MWFRQQIWKAKDLPKTKLPRQPRLPRVRVYPGSHAEQCPSRPTSSCPSSGHRQCSNCIRRTLAQFLGDYGRWTCGIHFNSQYWNYCRFQIGGFMPQRRSNRLVLDIPFYGLTRRSQFSGRTSARTFAITPLLTIPFADNDNPHEVAHHAFAYSADSPC